MGRGGGGCCPGEDNSVPPVPPLVSVSRLLVFSSAGARDVLPCSPLSSHVVSLPLVIQNKMLRLKKCLQTVLAVSLVLFIVICFYERNAVGELDRVQQVCCQLLSQYTIKQLSAVNSCKEPRVTTNLKKLHPSIVFSCAYFCNPADTRLLLSKF